MGLKVGVTKAVSLLVKLVLARLLVPEMFGLVAMVMVTIGFLQLFAGLGLKNALIQRRRDADSPLRYDSAFWLLSVAGAVMAGMVWLAGVPLMVWFYDEPRLEPIGAALAIALWLGVMQTLPKVRLTRLMKFGRMMRAEIYGVLAGAVLAIALALAGAGLWAIVGQHLATSTVTLIALWTATSWRPRRRFDAAALRPLIGFSSYMMANAVLFYMRKHLDVIIVGKLLGATALGVYTLAFLLTETIRMQLYSVVNKVMFPAYSRMQDDPAAMKPYYLATIRWMALITWPISTLLILLADPLIPLLFGEVWSEAVRPVQILAVASMVFALSGTPAEVLKGLGQAQLLFKISFYHTLLVALPSVAVGALLYGIEGAALGVLVHYVVARVVFHLSIRKKLEIREIDVLKAASYGVMASLITVLAIILVN